MQMFCEDFCRCRQKNERFHGNGEIYPDGDKKGGNSAYWNYRF